MSEGAEPVIQPHPTVRAVMRERSALGLSFLGGLFYWLGFATKESWPAGLAVFAFVSFVPLLIALRGRTGWRAIRLGWIFGTVACTGGFYWITEMLKTFSGFPMALCIVFSLFLWAGTGIIFAVFAWIIARSDARDVPRLVSVPLALAASEMVVPVLFPWYTANSLHRFPVLFQTADLGGVLLVSAALGLGCAAISEAFVRAGDWKTRLRPLVYPLAFWAFAIPYGVWRIGQVDAVNRDPHTRSLKVGIVQQNLGLMQKRHEPMVALVRHLAASHELERQNVDLIVWAESALAYRIPENITNIRQYIDIWDLHTPVLFGALSIRGGDDRPRYYNTAFMTDASGHIVGTYDKVYLLAFGEYIPLGDVFPAVYEISRNSGHFTRGESLRAVPIPGGTVAPLICYEDVLPRFVRDFQRTANPDLLAVILNDAWFGDTAEPWIHNALAKFRAVEHRRDLIRSANAGVSSIIDAAGRHVAHGGTFRRENVVGRVHLRQGNTVYYYLGDWIGWAGVLLALYAFAPQRWVRRKSA